MQTATKTYVSIPEARASSFKKGILRLRYFLARLQPTAYTVGYYISALQAYCI
jgi:hypothetical protein